MSGASTSDDFSSLDIDTELFSSSESESDGDSSTAAAVVELPETYSSMTESDGDACSGCYSSGSSPELGGSVQPLNCDSDYEEWSVNEDVDDVSLENDEANVDSNMFEPLYDGASITICGAYCALMEFKRACRLPFTTIDKLLELLHLLCPSNNKLPSSIYKLKKFFTKFTST